MSRQDDTYEFIGAWDEQYKRVGFEADFEGRPIELLIRCKECKHWNEYYRECNSPNWDTGTDDCFVVPAGFYCGWAERNEDQETRMKNEEKGK